MPRGRRTKLTPVVQKKIVDALSAGNYFEVACEYAGINPIMGCEWMQRGRGEHPKRPKTPLYAEFAEAVTRAQAEDEVHTIARLKKAGQGGDLIEETTYKEPDVVKMDADGNVIERRTGKQRTVRRYSPPQPGADEWRMERKHTQRWGRHDRVDVHTHRDALAAEIAEEFGMTPEQVLAEVEAHKKGLRRVG